MVDGGKELFDHRMNQLEKYKEVTENHIGKALQGEYGFNVMHEGSFPRDWVKPGGLPCDHYRPTCNNMLTSVDVVNKKELSFPKCTREGNIFERTVNITNQC